ncbi:hypothetical protein, partial [Saccharothrix sp. ST-888]|uniref:hypothetical protein n=1 Tax=Saccharothrix sp. ST-888 TaxID=1427391 RepID=UPI000AF23B89
MRLTRCAFVASTVAASASAFGLPPFFPDWTSQASDATQVGMVSAAGASRIEAESPQLPFTTPGPQGSAPPCHSYAGPYCGWVGTYWGRCATDSGLSFGFKTPDFI